MQLRGNVGENQRGALTCRRNLCSYSGYQKYSFMDSFTMQTLNIYCILIFFTSLVFSDITSQRQIFTSIHRELHFLSVKSHTCLV